MRKKYFLNLLVTVFFFLAYVSVSAQPGCSSLEITTTQDGAVCGTGSVKLEATSSGTGDDVVWYDAAAGGNLIGYGSSIYTPEISTTTSYWAAEANVTGGTGQVGPVDPTIGTTSTSSLTSHYMEFDVLAEATIVSVDIFPVNSGDQGSIEIRDSSGAVLHNISYTTTESGGSTAQTIALNAQMQPGADYRMAHATPGVTLTRNTTGASYPYTSPKIEITGNSFNSSYVYYHYNWIYSDVVVDCESPRVEVIATVNDVADEDITAFPYSHVANSSSYDNNYSGLPGSDCGSDDAYLDGYDVVYHYAADDDYLLDIELSGLSETHTAVFVYEDCADIGTSCAAQGSVSNGSTDDHGFELAVEDGKDYYIVVSSSLPTESFDYTLTIDAVLCSNMDAPIGDATQAFFDGQTVSDLTVDGVGLTWYSDAALTTVIADPDSELLVDNTIYYLTQSVDTCEGQALAITVTETSCATLAVASTEGAAVCGTGSVTLTAQKTSSSSSVDIFWYDSATGGDKVGSGEIFETPALTQTTSFWATEVAITGGELAGQAKPTYTTVSGASGKDWGLIFDANNSFTIVDVEVYSTGSGGDITIELQDDSGNMIEEGTFAVAGGGTSSVPVTVTIPLNFEVPAAGEYRLVKTSSGVSMIREFSANNTFPYSLGSHGEITNGYINGPSSSYYWFYNWTIGEMEMLCESSREEVVAEVNNIANEIVSGAMPFTHTAETADYGNNYAGEAGGSCDNGNYLDGYDVVYQFTPTSGAVYSIGLSGLTDDEMGVFVFESCSDIGSGCFAGAVSDGTTSDFGIEEVMLYENTDYYILISSKNMTSADYTITIDQAQIDCTDYTEAPIGRENQLFQAGDALGDLVITGIELSYYADAALTTTLSDTDLIVDGDTYYITQTINTTCESDALEVTVELADCTVLEVTSTDAGDAFFCSGETTISAVGSGTANTVLYWFDAAADGNILGIGEDLDTGELTETTSFWVAEVLEYEEDASPLPSYCIPTFNTGCTSSDTIDDFILEDSSGVVLISHLGTGCSTDAYGDYTGDANLTATLMAGEAYGFEATHGTSNQRVRVWIDLDRNGSFEDAGELLYEATSSASSSIPTIGNFTIPNVVGSFTTVMRVRTTYGTGAADSCTQSSNWGEVHDYLITIKGASAFCESARTEVVVEVDKEGDHVVSNLPYTHSDTTGSYANNYAGAPGSDCATTDDYLDGHEVIYSFLAAADDVLTVELTGLVGEYAGVFVYDSCLNIGTECMDGAVAGATEDDLLIENLQVVQGETYYIVVSSWQTTSVDYTLNISSFACAALEAPTGDATQEFVAGDVVSDLDVQPTRPGATLNWYEDATLSISITDPDTELLVDATTYYVTQLFGGCEGDALAIIAEEFDCSTFEIVSFTNAEVICSGSVELEAVSSGTGTDIYWYDAATDGNVVGRGGVFTTPVLTQTTSYWAAEAYVDGVLPESGLGKVTNTGNSGYAPSNTNDFGLVFNATQGFTLIDVEVLSTGAGGSLDIELRENDTNGAVITSATVNVVGGGTNANPVTDKITLNFDIPGPGTYYLAGFNGPSIIRDTGAALNSFPYSLGSFGEITSGHTWNGSFPDTYYFFYNWSIGGGDLVCESLRQEVVATVKSEGNYIVTDADLMYVDQNDTAGFGSNYPTGVGANCVTNDAIEGEGVVYSYIASQTDGDILMIELSDVTVSDALVLVYESCSDFGVTCFASAEVDNGIALIEDLYVDAGSELFILVTSKTGSFDYTLTIDGLDCNNVAVPTGDVAPFFIAGDFLSSLEVDGSIHNQGFTWYSDAALTTEIIDPSTELLVDNTTYYVTQTVLDCESDALAITAMEFDCSFLSPDILTPQVDLCLPGGEVTLHAVVNAGDQIRWYDSETAVDPIIKNDKLDLGFVDTTVSYWVSEVTLGGTGYTDEQGKVAPDGSSSFASTLNYGLQFDVDEDFILHSVDVYPNVSGDLEISVFDSSGTLIDSVTETVSASPTDPVTIVLDFEIEEGQGYRLLQTSSPSIALVRDLSGNNFPYALGDFGEYGTITNGTYGTSTSNVTTYYYFYNWVLGVEDVICESVREEVKVIVSDEFPDAPEVDSTVVLCGDENFTLADIEVIGDNIQWYDSLGNEMDLSTLVYDGDIYYVTQKLGGCISQIAPVTIVIRDISDMPIADAEQTFVDGETLANLEVDGRNIRWYDDVDKTNELLLTTKLVDDTTYYVTQTLTGLCESEPLAIKAIETLSVTDMVFENIKIAPNPVVDFLHIINIEKVDEIEVYDLTGRKLMSYTVGNNRNEMKIDFTPYSTGVYFLNLTKEGKAKRIRIIKK